MLTALATAQDYADAFARHGAPSFPLARDTAAWASLALIPAARERLARATEAARLLRSQSWPELPASLYLDYSQTGNRERYETPYFARRQRVELLALAYLHERQGSWLTALADGLWLICDERSWCLPAHARHDGPQDQLRALPDEDRIESLDLFACQTALILAEICELLGDAIDTVHPAIRRRVKGEILRRILTPLLTGWQPSWYRMSHNWVPWCAISCVGAASWVLADQPAQWGSLVQGMMTQCDRFMDSYGADGGCDEGVMYWSVAGAALGRLLEEVDTRSGGRIDAVWRDAKLRNILRYPARCHIGGGWYPAFADSLPRPDCVVSLAWRLAQRTADRALGAWAAGQMASESPERATGSSLVFNATLRRLWWVDAHAVAPQPGEVLEDAWFPDLQMLVAHGGVLTLAAKGGHNNEHHNHNDLGQVVIHHRGKPVLVDVGRGEYTAQTFSGTRYELWWTRGSGHAVPILDDLEQAPGGERMARVLDCSLQPARVALELDCSSAYPIAGVVMRRRITLERGSAATMITISDRIAGARHYVLPLHLASAPQAADGGSGADGVWLVGGVRLSAPGLSGTISAVDLRAETVLRRSWPGGLWRLTLSGLVPTSGEIVLQVTPA